MRWLLCPLAAIALLSVGCAAASYPPSARALRDAELAARIKTALLNAPGIDATRIDVRAVEGAVTLAGVVPSDDHLQKALELVRQVPGVIDVESRMAVAAKPTATSRVRRRTTAPS
jgi:hypothetical protein